MKKLLFIFALFFACITIQAQTSVTITGHIYDDVTGIAVANHPVMIMSDSMNAGMPPFFFYYNTVFTNSLGEYQDVVTVPPASQIMFYISTHDCNGNYLSAQGMSTNSPIVNDFTICTSVPVSCHADFVAIPDSGMNPLAFHFLDLSFPVPATWSWDFGDNTTSNAQNPFHTYSQPGTYQVCLTVTNGTPGTSSFCTDTYCETIVVNSNPGGCSNYFIYTLNNLTADFTGYINSNSPPFTFNWDFGDGNTGNGQNVQHTYSTSGVYNVSLTTTDATGCAFTSLQPVHINGMPSNCQASYTILPDSLDPMTLHFVNTSTGNITFWMWDFGDGMISHIQNPTHTYMQPGVYMVCLHVMGNSGLCQDIFCDTVMVGGSGACNVHFTHWGVGMSRHFDGQMFSMNPPFVYNWDFGDGTASNLEDPVHQYNQPGIYQVCLTATDATGCTANYCDNVIIDTLQTQCHANFFAFPDSSMNPMTLQFVDMSSPVPSTWLWDFGDGSTSTLQNPSHTYSQSGVYQVCLTITTGTPGTTFFCTDTYCETVVVNNNPGGCSNYFTYTINNLTADFTGYVNSNNPPFTYGWDFGDGNTGSGQNVQHTYSTSGMYNVSLTTTDATGCTFTSFQPVHITGMPSNCQASYTALPDSLDPMTIHFVNNSTGNISFWMWDFGDGMISHMQNPTHTYMQPGVYTVCLHVMGNSGMCQDMYCDSVVVAGGPSGCHAHFFAIPDSSMNPMAWQFIDMSYPVPSAWSWDFGDGTTSNIQNPVHVFSQSGVYQVCLTITSVDPATGTTCTDMSCESVMVNNIPGGCTNNFTYQVSNLNVTFSGTANTSSPPVGYMWDFGDGTTGAGQNVSHSYSQQGVYNVSLTTTDSAGCVAVTFKMVPVMNSVNVDIYGHLFTGYGFADHGMAILYAVDPMGIISGVDTVLTDSMGMYHFYNLQQGVYYVKGELTPNSAYYQDFFPTYYGNSLIWIFATPIIIGGPANNPYDITLIPSFGPSAGPGNINGSVTNGGTKLFGKGEPAKDIEILLFDDNDNALTFDWSDGSGLFDFSSVSYGTYKVHAEVTGLTTTPVYVTLSAANPNATVDFIVTSTGVSTNITDRSSPEAVVTELYPNPSNTETFIGITVENTTDAEIMVFDPLGKLVFQKEITLQNGENIQTIDVSGFEQGVYSLRIVFTDGNSFSRKFVRMQ